MAKNDLKKKKKPTNNNFLVFIKALTLDKNL